VVTVVSPEQILAIFLNAAYLTMLGYIMVSHERRLSRIEGKIDLILGDLHRRKRCQRR